MKDYLDRNRKSGISAYASGIDYITVKFKTGESYTYSTRKNSLTSIETMQGLAEYGAGLNTYINKYVKYKND